MRNRCVELHVPHFNVLNYLRRVQRIHFCLLWLRIGVGWRTAVYMSAYAWPPGWLCPLGHFVLWEDFLRRFGRVFASSHENLCARLYPSGPKTRVDRLAAFVSKLKNPFSRCPFKSLVVAHKDEYGTGEFLPEELIRISRPGILLCRDSPRMYDWPSREP